MVGMVEIWCVIVVWYVLVEFDFGWLVLWWYSDVDFGWMIEVLIDMTKSRECGFLGFCVILVSFRSRIE